MKTVLVTGAGRGLGRAIAEAYHVAGYFVIATDIKINLLSDLTGVNNYLTIKLDVSNEAEVSSCAKKIADDNINIDIIVSNAGIFDFYSLSESGATKLKKIFDVNVFGLANLTKYFLSQLIKSKGRLIVIGSESYKVPSPFQPYSVSKQMLESIYQSVKMELELKEIRCILIRPGAMQTKIIEDTINFKTNLDGSVFKEEFSGFIASVPKYISRVLNPTEVAQLILKAGTLKAPKPIYHINHNPMVTLLSGLPKKLQNYIVGKSLKRDS